MTREGVNPSRAAKQGVDTAGSGWSQVRVGPGRFTGEAAAGLPVVRSPRAELSKLSWVGRIPLCSADVTSRRNKA